MSQEQEEPVYTPGKEKDFENIVPFEFQLSLDDFTHFILSNCALPSDNPFNIAGKMLIIKNYYD